MNVLHYYLNRFSSIRDIPEVMQSSDRASGRKVLDGSRACGLPITRLTGGDRKRNSLTAWLHKAS